MNKIVIVCAQERKEQYKELMRMIGLLVQREGYDSDTVFIKEGDSTIVITDKLREEDVVFVITIDFAGFEMKTLLEDAVYNIVAAKQLHIVVDRDCLKNYIQNEFAINLYFAFPSNENIAKQKFALNILEYSMLERNENGVIADSEKNNRELEKLFDCFVKDVKGL